MFEIVGERQDWRRRRSALGKVILSREGKTESGLRCPPRDFPIRITTAITGPDKDNCSKEFYCLTTIVHNANYRQITRINLHIITVE